MSKKKLKRYAENLTFPHLFQSGFQELQHGFPLRGSWNTAYFQNSHPITLELGCGKGEYTIYLAKKYPDHNVIGIDIKGARLWRGCKTVEEEKLQNVAFIRTRIQLIEQFFSGGEVEQVWITFPDPQPKQSKEQKRLTSPEFLERYRRIMKPGGIIHLKTDNNTFFEYTLDILRQEGHKVLLIEKDVYNSGFSGEASAVTTFYEKMFLSQGIPIKYLQFQLCNE